MSVINEAGSGRHPLSALEARVKRRDQGLVTLADGEQVGGRAVIDVPSKRDMATVLLRRWLKRAKVDARASWRAPHPRRR